MADFAFTTTAEQDVALAELLAKSQEAVTPDEYFAQRTHHWLAPVVEEYRQRVRETYAAEAQRTYERANAEERAQMDALREKYRDTP